MQTANLMSLQQVAKYLLLSERTIYMWAKQEKIPAYKLGSMWKFKKESIDEWVESCRVGPPPDSWKK
tara:strand:- start:343 stop:543 length:201 start_codon:yes stop_codon:yes gene_type:complete